VGCIAGGRKCLGAAALTSVCALAFLLRTNGVGDLSVQGDYAYSVYAAQRDLLTIARERVLDGHPPLYYYLLHFWMLLAGSTEYAVRFPSAVAGALIVPVVWRLAANQTTRWAGVLAALLVATSPALIQPSRSPRMYIFLALFAVLSIWALCRALAGNRWSAWAGWAIATLALLYTHYYGIAVIAAEGVYALWVCRQWLLRLKRPAVLSVGIAAAYLPWLAFAALGSATTTAKIISNAPSPTSIMSVSEMYWIPLNLGEYLPLEESRWLGGVMLLLAGASLVFSRGCFRQRGTPLGLPLAVLSLSVIGSLAVFLWFPYAVRPRFLLYCAPLYLLALATAVSGLGRRLAISVTFIFLVIFGYTLAQLYEMEPLIVEPDAIQLSQHLEAAARPGDAVILHAYWQAGYLATHYHGPPVTTYSLRELSISNIEGTLAGHERVWLSMFRTNERNADYPLEEWLDRRWAMAGSVNLGESRLKLYLRPHPGTGIPAGKQFLTPDGLPVIELQSVQPPATGRSPGDALAVGLRWAAASLVTERYSAFVQIIDSQGRRLAGADREPLAGSEPTAGWPAGKVVDDWVGLVLPDGLPPGEYSIRAGLHPADSPTPLRVKTPGADTSETSVLVSRIVVSTLGSETAHISHKAEALLGDRIRLLGYGLDIDAYRVEQSRSITALTDIPIKVYTPKRSYRPGDVVTLMLYWQADGAPDRDYTIFAHLVDDMGRPVAQSDGPPIGGVYPTSSWLPGAMAIDQRGIRIGPDTPVGQYRLRVGMYRPDTMERLRVTGPAGDGDYVDLGFVVVVRP
jgi:mannosyltransferase